MRAPQPRACWPIAGKQLPALEHQDFPSHLLTGHAQPGGEHTQPGRKWGRSHLFQVTFILQKPQTLARRNAGDEGMTFDLGGLRAEMIVLERRFARQDLELEMLDLGGPIYCWFHYDTELFDRDQIARMEAHFVMLLQDIVANPLQRVAGLRLITESELQQLASDWSNSGTDYSRRTTVSQLFKQQAARTPQKPAAVSGGGSLSFRDLDERAERLASVIRDLKG